MGAAPRKPVYRYGSTVTRLGIAYTAGRDGKPFLGTYGAKGSAAHVAWKAGRDERRQGQQDAR